ncbi:unnamed protein product [Cochlearia groenlandica]
MNQAEKNDIPGPYTSPPPIGYPTREAMVGDPPAPAVETKSKGDELDESICKRSMEWCKSCMECCQCCLEICACFASCFAS